MNKQQQTSTLKAMLALIAENTSTIGEAGTISVSDYTSAKHLESERNTLFKDIPILAGHASQLAEPSSFITLDTGTTPLLLNRDRNGVLHAFINSCRHRGAKLSESRCGKARAFKCPYHAWSYMDDGELKFVPKPELFPDLDKSQHGLVKLPVKIAGGFIWVIPNPKASFDDDFLGEVETDLNNFGLDDHIVRVSEIQRPNCNWKLVIDAFSEGYHLKSLHKDSVEPFFMDHGTVFEKMGSHSRTVGPRKTITQAATTPEADWDFRAWTTPFYNLFPNTILVFHPDWISRITVFPKDIDNCTVYHDMLVHKSANIEDKYWDKTFALINEQVFAKEDIAVCENIQSAARSNADAQWLTGGLETPVLWFHQECKKVTEKN